MPNILLTNHYSEKVLELVNRMVPEGFSFDSLQQATKENLLEKAPRADYFLASGRVNIDKEIINSAKNLRMVQRTGVGTDTIDIITLKEKKIPVYINPGVNAFSVAEHTLLLILSVLRQLPKINSSIRQGIWGKNDIGLECRSLSNKTIGLIGVGNIGKNVINLIKPFGVRILYYDVFRLDPNEENQLNIEYKKIEELLPLVDILSLHCPLTNETKGFIGKSELDALKPEAFIINTGRGKLINEAALIDALKNKKIRGAGLDVYENEPVDKNNPLLHFDNVVLTPHVGGLTLETFSMMINNAFENIKLFNSGKLDAIANKML